MIKSQADQRRNAILTDQHGRQFSASIEKASGWPTGLVVPMFDVPHPQLMPPQKYMVFDAENPTQLRIDYEAWIMELEDANRLWEENRIRTGHMISAGFDSKAPMPPELQILLGNRPMSPVPVKAMQQGNRWALGFTKVRPPEADQFFPQPSKAPDSLAFTETAPVFAEEGGAALAPIGQLEPAAAVSLAELLEQLDKECPAEIRGAHRTAWKMEQLKLRAAQPQEA
jgi:hypothetical protein